MTNREIYERFHNMKGDPADRIEILARENDCAERVIKAALQEAQREGKPCENYHPDENPFCRVHVELRPDKGDIPDYVLDLIFDRLDELDQEIKERQDEYNKLIEYMGGKQ